MRSSWPFLFTILVLIAMSICSGCVLQPRQNQTPVQNISPVGVNGGISQIPAPSEIIPISLSTALQQIEEIKPDSDIGTMSRKEYFYVLGRNLDGTGKTDTWFFGTRSPTGNELQVYDRNRWTTIPWTATLPPEEMQFDRILLPEELINQSRNEIAVTAGPNGIREIELKNGIYSLTLKDGSTERILAFNATTGALIAQK